MKCCLSIIPGRPEHSASTVALGRTGIVIDDRTFNNQDWPEDEPAN